MRDIVSSLPSPHHQRSSSSLHAHACSHSHSGCPHCPSLLPHGHACTAPGYVNCSCPLGETGRREIPAGKMKPLCTDGASPGKWVKYDQWEADNCQYR